MTANKLFNQMLADTLGRTIVVSKMAEISGWGAAVAAGIGAQAISLDSFAAYANPQMVKYQPENSGEERLREITRWQTAIQKSRGWANLEFSPVTKS